MLRVRRGLWWTLCASSIAAWCAAGVVVWTPAASQDLRVEPILKPYLDLLELYREDPEAAVETIVGWRERDVSEDVSALMRRSVATGAILQESLNLAHLPTLCTAIMLHTDAVVTAVRMDSRTTATLHLTNGRLRHGHPRRQPGLRWRTRTND